MFFGGEDDDDSFLPSGGGSSKLASLFGSDKTSSTRGNTSLTYTAPTEPKKKKQVESTESHEAANTAVLHAVAVTAYKLVEGNFTSQGKLGAAIIGNHSESSYKLLLYVSKQQQVTHVVINANFHFTIQPSNYANFYDSSRQNWSVLFESAKQLAEFARQIAITRANSVAGSLDTLIIQDLGLGDGEALEHGDSVEVKYTGWLWEEHGPGQVFDTNSNSEKLFRFRLGKGKVIKGWDEGLPGMKKGSSRLLIVPPSLAYGAEGISPKVPAGATLVFEVDVVRIKFAKEKEPPQVYQTTTAARTDTESEADGGVKARSKSISEQLVHHEVPKTDKARLISRMAKMGQPMLPGIVAAAPGQPDSDHETEESQTVASTSPCVSPKPVLAAKPVLSASVHSSVTSAQPSMTAAPVGQPVQPAPTQHLHLHPEQVSQMALYQPLSLPQSHLTQPGYPPGALAASVPYLPPTPMYAPQPYTGVSSEVNVMMSESRQQNTEVRLAVGSIADKIDRLTEKIDRLDKGSGNAVAMMGVLPNMETDVLLHNLQRIIQENDRLKKDLSERTTKAETQNDKISELLQRNQRLMEQNNTFLEKSSCTFEASATHSRAVIQAVEQEKAQLTAQLTAATAQVGALQTTVNSLKKHESELDQQVAAMHDTEQRRKKDLEDVTLKLTESEQTLEEIQRETDREKQIHRQQDHQQHSLEEEFSEIKAANDTLEKKLTDLKRKFAKEKKELEDEMDKLKTQHEVSQAKEWQEKCDQLVSSANKKHQRELDEWKAEKGQLEEIVEALERKYANLRSRAGEMKEHYEEKLAQERETREMGADPQAVVAEVKKIMNSVYQNLRAKFVSDKSYAGADIHSTILHAIKTVTLQLVERQKMQDEEASQGGEKGKQQGLEDRIEAMMSPETSQKPIKSKSLEDQIEAVMSHDVQGKKPLEDRIEAMMCEGSTEKKVDNTVEETVRAVAASMTGGGGGNPYYAAELEAAGKPQGVDVIQRVVAPFTGDRGNPHYAAELEAGKPHKDVQPVLAAQVTTQLAGKAPTKGKKKSKPVVSAKVASPPAGKAPEKDGIKAVVAQVTGGGGGNPHYAAELEKGGKDKSKDLHDVIKPVVAMATGDKGNPHYAAELAHSHQQENSGSGVGRSEVGKKPVKSEETKDSSKRSGSKTATDKMDAVFAGIADAMEDTSKTSDKQSKKAASKEKQKQETILAATDALFSDPFFDASLPKTDATEGSKKHKGKSQSEKPVSGADDDLAARLGIITTPTSKKTPSKSSTIKPSTRTTNSDDDLKPRPPPQPLFVDDDDDDLDWMK